MKVFVLAGFAFISLSTGLAQSFEEFAYQDQHQLVAAFGRKYQSSSAPVARLFAGEDVLKRRNEGRVLTFAGVGAMLIAGAIVLPTLGQTTTTTCNPCTVPQTSSQDQIGGILFVAGLVATTIGLVQWTKASREIKRNKLSFDWRGAGGVLRYRF